MLRLRESVKLRSGCLRIQLDKHSQTYIGKQTVELSKLSTGLPDSVSGIGWNAGFAPDAIEWSLGIAQIWCRGERVGGLEGCIRGIQSMTQKLGHLGAKGYCGHLAVA
jgi:hypothetical protein